MQLDLFQPIESHLAQNSNKPALITPDGQELSYQKLATTVEAFTNRALKAGVSAGSHVAIEIPNHTVQLCLILAFSRLGAVCMIGNTANGFLGDGVQVDYLISTELRFGANPISLIFTQDWFEPEPFNKSGNTFSGYPNRQSPSLICATSGTTGNRKYYTLSIDTLLKRIPLYGRLLGIRTNSLMLTMTLDSLVGLLQALRVLHKGGLFVRPAGSPQESLELVQKHKIEEIFTTPNVLADLVACQQQTNISLNSLKLILTAGSAISNELEGLVNTHLCSNSYQMYGSTETGPVVWGKLKEEEGAIGEIVPWAKIEVLDDDGNNQTTGRPGVIRVCVPQELCSKPYFPSDEFDEKASIRGKWFYPGDWGIILDNGQFFLSGRLDDRINAGGNKFAASSIEAHCLKHPDVASAAAFGIKNSSGFDDIAIAVSGKEALIADNIVHWVQNKFGKTSSVQVVCVGSIPVNAAGKTDKHKLKILFNNTTAEGG